MSKIIINLVQPENDSDSCAVIHSRNGELINQMVLDTDGCTQVVFDNVEAGDTIEIG